MSRLLGLDWGSKRIGVAVSDDRARLAVGYGIWPADDEEFFPRLEKAVREERIELLIVGYPLTLRGETGPKAREVDQFIEKLTARGYEVKRCDERFTTSQAGRDMSRLGLSEKKKRGKMDMSAAVLILQSYLDAAAQQGDAP